MRKLSDFKPLPIDKTDDVCEKCGQKLEFVFVPCGGFFPPGRYLLCPNCHTVKNKE